VVSLRRTPFGRPRSHRRTASAGFVAFSALLMVMMTASPAVAQPPAPAPPPPTTAADAQTQLAQAQHDAEALTEEWHNAKDALDAKTKEADDLKLAVDPAKLAADTAKQDEEKFRQQIDTLAISTFDSGSLDQFNALLASDSPQDFLDQMSALEVLSSDYRTSLGELTAVVDRTSAAQADADAAVQRANDAVIQASQAEKDVDTRKDAAEKRIDDVMKILQRLTPEQRRENEGPTVSAPATPVTGTGAGAKALQVAMTKLGDPYQYGATGPGKFDCSGLVYYSFKQIGVTVPRASRQQSTIGSPVSFNDLQVGDLLFFYSPVSHVGIYVGDGKMINAPSTGDVVKYANINRSNFTTARRV
jgi:cell wall-associated NlpC family hydrolase